MEKRYSIADARNRLPSLVHDVERTGGAVELTRRGRPVAVILSLAGYGRLAARKRDFWSALTRWRRSGAARAIGTEDVFANVRDRSSGRRVRW